MNLCMRFSFYSCTTGSFLNFCFWLRISAAWPVPEPSPVLSSVPQPCSWQREKLEMLSQPNGLSQNFPLVVGCHYLHWRAELASCLHCRAPHLCMGPLWTHVRGSLTKSYSLSVETQTSQEATSFGCFWHSWFLFSQSLPLGFPWSQVSYIWVWLMHQLRQKLLGSFSGLCLLKLNPQVSGPSILSGGENQHRVSPTLCLLLISLPTLSTEEPRGLAIFFML